MDAEGKPFFWLAETAWWMTFKLDRGEIADYFQDRKQKEFTVIQGPCALWYHSGKPNADEKSTWYGNVAWENTEGHKPFLGGETNVDSINPFYWQYYDYIVEQAAQQGLYLMFVTMWEQHVDLFTEDQHYRLGRFLGQRYKDQTHIIWCLGGEVSDIKTVKASKLEALVKGINKGREGGVHQLMMMHSSSVKTSLHYHNRDFNQINNDQEPYDSEGLYQHVLQDWEENPPRPSFIIETGYEGIEGINAFETRRAAYYSVFAGGIGFGYGANAVWQFWKGGNDPDYGGTNPKETYQVEMRLEGVKQMKYLKELVLSRPNYFDRVPDSTKMISGAGEGLNRALLMRDTDSWLMVYLPNSRKMTLDTKFLACTHLKIIRFNPITGTYLEIARKIKNTGKYVANVSGDKDFVLLIEGK